MHYSNVSFHTFGYSLPPNVLSSEAIEDRLSAVYSKLKLPRGRLELMSGIRERRLWNKGTRPSQGAALAGHNALQRAGVSPKNIQSLIFTSVSRDMMEPATASFVHNDLGLAEQCLIFDISNACLGFLDGILMLANMIELGQVENGLIVAGETAEQLLESTIETLLADESLTRKTIKPVFASLTIGSGSVALYMCKSQDAPDRPRLVHTAWRANTACSHLCQGNQNSGDNTLMATDSEELLVQGVNTANNTWQDFMLNSGWTADDIDCFFCHQVGSAHAKLLFNTLQLEPEKNFQTLETLGNVGSVSAPITMAMAMENSFFQAGQRGAILGIGSGINCLMLGIDWGKK